MNVSLRSWTRFAPWLGRALVVEALLGIASIALPSKFRIFSSSHCLSISVHAAQLLLMLLLGASIALKARQGLTPNLARRLLKIGLAGMATSVAALFVGMTAFIGSMSGSFFLEALGSLLTVCAGSLLWGAAAARQQNPLDARVRRFGRISGTVALCGLVLLLLPDAWMLSLGVGFDFWKNASAFIAISYLLQGAERVFLFWSSVDTLRSARDPELIVRRALRVERLMLARFLIAVIFWIAGALYWAFSSSSGPVFSIEIHTWQSLVYFTLAPLIAMIAAAALENPARREEFPRGDSE